MSSFSDDFNRVDAENLGSNWTEHTAGFKIRSGAAVPDTTATNVGQMNASLFTGDHEAEVQIGNTYGGTFTGVACRMPGLGADGTSTGTYYVLLLSGSTGTAFSIRRKAASTSSLTSLGTGNSAGDARVDGSLWRLRVYDDPTAPGSVRLEGYVNDVLVVSTSDTSGTVPNTQRRVGIYTGGSTAATMRFARISATDVTVTAPSADVTPPSVPTGVTASASASSAVVVTWTASTDDTGVASYRVRRDGVDVAGATAITALTYTDTGLAAGTYLYTVSAVDAAGNRSTASSAASVTLTTAVDTTPPPTPTGGVATAGAGQVVVTWSAVTASDLVGYRVYRWTDAAPAQNVIATLGKVTSYTDTGVVGGTTYYYSIASRDTNGNVSGGSTILTATPSTPSGGSSAFSVFNGTTTVPLTLQGVWNGTTVAAVSSVSVSS